MREVWMTFNDPETPCTKVARYLNKFVDGSLEEFKKEYKEIVNRINI